MMMIMMLMMLMLLLMMMMITHDRSYRCVYKSLKECRSEGKPLLRCTFITNALRLSYYAHA